LTEQVLSSTQPEVRTTLWLRMVRNGNLWLGVLWRWLSRPWLLIVISAIIFGLASSAYLLRQMPGQLNDDPLAAARWLISVGAEYGLVGDLFRALGLFNVLYSPILHLLLALLGLILLVDLGEQIGSAWHIRKLPSLLAQPQTSAGTPLALVTMHPLYRWRQSYPAAPQELLDKVRSQLAARFTQVEGSQVSLPGLALGEPTPEWIMTSAIAESRLLATRHRRWLSVRPLLLVGLLLLLLVVWLNVAAGWVVSPPALAPGRDYRYAARDLALRYVVTEQADNPDPGLEVRVGSASQRLSTATNARLQVGQVEVQTWSGPPGLWINAGGEQVLAERPNQPTITTAAVGLIFPNPGSEESVVLPAQGVALRIVRTAVMDGQNANTGTFMVEVYYSEQDQPSQRIQVSKAQTATLTLADHTINLSFVPLPTLLVQVRYSPWAWLLWPALLLIILGAVSYWFRPAFILVQLAPWPEQRSVLIVQSDVKHEAETLRQWATLGPPSS